jgi:hypothetical protein
LARQRRYSGRALGSGPLVIGEYGLAEITPALTKDDLSSFLADWNILFVPSSRESSILAGEMYHDYPTSAEIVNRSVSFRIFSSEHMQLVTPAACWPETGDITAITLPA